MNTEFCEDYWSPGGSDCTLLAGAIANLNANSRVLDIGCGSGADSINLALKFSSPCFAVDSEVEYIEMANAASARFGVDDKVKCLQLNFHDLERYIQSGNLPDSYDFVIAEGGLASYVGLQEFFGKLSSLLTPNGFFAISDLVFREGVYFPKSYSLHFSIPLEVRSFYSTGGYADSVNERSQESQYEELCSASGLEKVFSFHLSRAHWRRYHSNMKIHALQRTGPALRDPSFVETTFHDEAFFNLEAQKYISYFYLIGKKIS